MGPRSLEGRVGLPPGLPTTSCPHTLEAVRSSGGILSGPPEGQAGCPISEPTAALNTRGARLPEVHTRRDQDKPPNRHMHRQRKPAGWPAVSKAANMFGTEGETADSPRVRASVL